MGTVEVFSATVMATLHGPARAHVSIAMVLTGILLVLACLAFRSPYLLFFKPGQPPKLFPKMAFLE